MRIRRIQRIDPDQDEQAEQLYKNYRILKNLGEGSFGKVKLAEHILTGEKVAIKVLNKYKIRSMNFEDKVRREIQVSSIFMHPHIIRIYEVIETCHDIFVIMEYVENGELFDYIVQKGRLDEDEARTYFQQLVSGLEVCHRNMIAHRDLKPENLLLDKDNRIKIADFGLSNVMKDGEMMYSSCGSPNYAAPEVLRPLPYNGCEVDVWSAGVVLYALLTGTLPFDDENIPNLYRKIKSGDYTIPNYVSLDAADLITKMLEVDPIKRITIAEIRNHSWFLEHLPKYLALHYHPVANKTLISEEVLQATLKFGYDREALIQSIKKMDRNDMTTSYFLMQDKITSEKDKFMHEAINEGNLCHSESITKRKLEHSDTFTVDEKAQSCQFNSASNRLVTTAMWKLGVKIKNDSPKEFIQQFLDALQTLDVKWKKVESHFFYSVRCIKPVQTLPQHLRNSLQNTLVLDNKSSNSLQAGSRESSQKSSLKSSANLSYADSWGSQFKQSAQKSLKFELSMIQDQKSEQEYVIDMKRLEGDSYIFFDICTELMSKMEGTTLMRY